MSNAFIQALLMDDPDAGGGSGPVDPDFPGGCTGDADWADVALALNFEGADNTLVLTDSSTYADHKTIVANAAISTTHSKFGGASLKLLQTEANIPTWSGTKFNSAAGAGATIEFWFKPTTRYNGSAAPAFFRVIDGTTGTAYIEMSLYATGNEISIRFEEAFNDFRQYTYTPDVDGWTHAAVCVGAAGGARVYLNRTLVVSRPNSQVFLTGAFGNPTTGCVVSVGRWGGTSGAALVCYIDGFRYTRKDKYAAGVPVFTLPLCNGVSDISPVSIPGTEKLTGIGMTATAGDVNSPAGFRRLTGQSMTAAAGSVSVFNANRTVALTGQLLVMSRGSLAYLPYPNLISETIDLNPIPTWGALEVTFLNDGTYLIEQVTYSYFGKVTYTGRWIDDSEIAETAIAHQYRCAALANYGDGTPTLDTGVSGALGRVSVAFVVPPTFTQYVEFSISVVPRVGNPRYGEIGYTGTFRISIPLYYSLPP